MTGPENYREAERCLSLGKEPGADALVQAAYFAAAQAHATLALAAATALGVADGDDAPQTHAARTWRGAIL